MKVNATSRWPTWCSRKRSVWWRKDVLILLDSITRLARAYNKVQFRRRGRFCPADSTHALHKPKRSSASRVTSKKATRSTVMATALIETGTRMDYVIFQEFKGTGNMELHLDRNLTDRRVFPAIDVRNGTRNEELLVSGGRSRPHQDAPEGPQPAVAGRSDGATDGDAGEDPDERRLPGLDAANGVEGSAMATITVRQNGPYKVEGDDVKVVELQRYRVSDREASVRVVPVWRLDRQAVLRRHALQDRIPGRRGGRAR